MCIGVYMNMHKCTYVSHDGLHVHFQTPAFTFACFWCMCDVNNILYLSALWGYVSAISFAPVRCYAAPLVLAAWRLIRAECRYAQCVTLTGMQDRPLPASKNSNILVILHYKMQKFACPGLRWLFVMIYDMCRIWVMSMTWFGSQAPWVPTFSGRKDVSWETKCWSRLSFSMLAWFSYRRIT